MGLATVAGGFSVATLRTAQIAHPVLLSGTTNAVITGFVEVREQRERTDRIVVRAVTFEGGRDGAKPQRVRVSVRKGTAPLVGSFVSFRARLNPPLEPLRPGGYDFARDLYFQNIGAVGFALGAIHTATPTAAPDWRLRYATTIYDLRAAIDTRIHAVLKGDNGAIASALITGTRDAISAPVNDAMYVSSLAHVLSISGYHMAVVAGVVFFVLRAGLAMVPALAIRHPIKKWAALVALIAAAGYLLLSGAEVATQRAFIMTAIVLCGVMLDRAALTLRTLAVAAFAVLALAPQSLVHPSFQMSFAATLALVAAYERGLRWNAGRDSSLGARVALWGGNEIAGLLLASLVAGFATMPYAAFHFHRLAPYGVVANLLAMPVVSAVVMPAGLLALVAMPFGFDGVFWRVMGEGIDWMVTVVLWVAALPGAVGRVPAFGIGPLLIGTAGILVLCLLKTPLRWTGAALAVLAVVLAAVTPPPEVLVSADGHVVAVRRADGQLAIHRIGSDTFAAREWLAADADARQPKDRELGNGIACDDAGCIAALADGRLVSMALRADAFEEDCARAALVVTAREGPADCAAAVIDRSALRATGAVALTRTGDSWTIATARSPGYDRPWARAAPPRPERAAPAAARRPAAPDATPRPGDLDAEDHGAPDPEADAASDTTTDAGDRNTQRKPRRTPRPQAAQ
jgi:competence protein ComEC